MTHSSSPHRLTITPAEPVPYIKFNEIGMSVTGQVEDYISPTLLLMYTGPDEHVFMAVGSAGLRSALRDAGVDAGDWICVTRAGSAPGSRKWQFTVSRPEPAAWAGAQSEHPL